MRSDTSASSEAIKPTGYQQGILLALGSRNGERFAVRSIDRWYPDQVQPLFGVRVYSIQTKGRESRQFTVKSANARPPKLDEVDDTQGFARAWIEIHGVLDFAVRKRRDGSHTHALRLRIYGPECILTAIMHTLPVSEKRIQHIQNRVQDIYLGQTDAIYYQSPQQVCDILDFIRGEPSNPRVWAEWERKLKRRTSQR